MDVVSTGLDLFKNLSRPQLSLALYFFPFPLFLLGSSFYYPLWDRFGLRWQVLCVSALSTAAIFLLSHRSSNLFWNWLIRSPFRWILPLGSLWLCSMGFAHGFFDSQAGALLSGFYALLMLPVLIYLGSSSKIYSFVAPLTVLVSAVVLGETILLYFYEYASLSPSSTFLLDESIFPRIFLNIRDGNCFALLLSCLIFFRLVDTSVMQKSSFCDSFVGLRSHLLRFYIPFLIVFLNAVQTNGRALIISSFFGILLVRFISELAAVQWRRIAVAMLMMFGFAIVVDSALQYFVFSGAGDGLSDGVNLMRNSSGRLVLWKAWLTSGLESSIFFGHGFDHSPTSFLPPGRWPADPHNLFISLFSDSGLLGVGFAAMTSVGIIRFFGFDRLRKDPFFVYSVSALAVFCSLSAVFGWSAGVWTYSIVLLLLFCRSFPELTKFNSLPSKLRDGAFALCMLWIAVLSVIQVYLISIKHVLLLPDVVSVVVS